MNVHNDTYPNGTLRNKLGITDAKRLSELEYRDVARRSNYLYLLRPFEITSARQLITIHHYLFSGFYTWAGVVRDYELSKGQTQFMFSAELSHGFDYIDSLLAKLPDGPLTAENYAQLLDSLNYLHPFREGNGRSTRLFLQLLALSHLQIIDYPRHIHDLVRAETDADIPALARLITIKDAPVSSTVEKVLEQYVAGQLAPQNGRH